MWLLGATAPEGCIAQGAAEVCSRLIATLASAASHGAPDPGVRGLVSLLTGHQATATPPDQSCGGGHAGTATTAPVSAHGNVPPSPFRAGSSVDPSIPVPQQRPAVAAATAFADSGMPDATSPDAAVAGARRPVEFVIVDATERRELAWPDIALSAAEVTPGGLLAVLTVCHRHDGAFVDPRPLLIASADEAGLDYLQHIVAIVCGGARWNLSIDISLFRRRHTPSPDRSGAVE